MASTSPSRSPRLSPALPSTKENCSGSLSVSSKLQRYSSSSTASSSSSPGTVPDLAALHLQHCPPRTNCHDPVSWTLDHSMDDECQMAEILTSIGPNDRPALDGPSLIQSDSMDGHVDPVSCQLMQEDDDYTDEGRDETSGGVAHRRAGGRSADAYGQDQSPAAPRHLGPPPVAQRPQAHRLQLFPMPSDSYSYDEE